MSWLEDLQPLLPQEVRIQLRAGTLIILLEEQQDLQHLETVLQAAAINLQQETHHHQEHHLRELHLTEAATLAAHQPEVHLEEVALQAPPQGALLQEEKDSLNKNY